MKSIINIVILFMLLFAGINVASAGELTFSRMLYVNEWSGVLATQADVDKVIEDAVYMRADAISVRVLSEYFDAARDPVNKGSWDNRVKTDFSDIGLPFLEYFIKKAHENNIEVHAWVEVNIVGTTANSKYKLFGPSAKFPYNEVNKYGVKKTTPYFILDIAFKEFQDYEIGILSWVATHYPELDGINFEEPIYRSYSYSTAVRERVNTKFGYDPRYPPAGKTQTQIEADMSVIQREAWNEFMTRMKKSIDTANTKRAKKIQLSASSVGYNKIVGFDPTYMSENMLLDWYAAQTPANTTEKFKRQISYTKYTKDQITNIPYVAIAFTTYHALGTDMNPAFFDQVRNAYDYGADGLGIFNYFYMKNRKVLNGQNYLDTLHKIIPPSGNTGAVATPTFSPSAGSYQGSQNISINTTTAGATIRYTIDDTTPVQTSTIYSKPIVISSNTTLKAKAWKTGLNESAVATAKYIIEKPVLSSIEVYPSSALLEVGSIQAFEAETFDQFDNPIAATITWTSSNESVGTITSSGIFTGTEAGTTTITAASGTVSGTSTIVIVQSFSDIIDNSGFESDKTSWYFFTGGNGRFSTVSPGYEGDFAAMISIGSADSNIQLSQKNVELEPDTVYRFSFSAYSTTGKDLTIFLMKHDKPYTNYGLDFTADLNTNWQTFDIEFTTSSFTGTVNDGRLMFWLAPFAGRGDTYYIDNIQLEKIE